MSSAPTLHSPSSLTLPPALSELRTKSIASGLYACGFTKTSARFARTKTACSTRSTGAVSSEPSGNEPAAPMVLFLAGSEGLPWRAGCLHAREHFAQWSQRRRVFLLGGGARELQLCA